MLINSNLTVGKLKELFQNQYPGLKIECYSTPHQKNELSSTLNQYKDNVKLIEINENFKSEEIDCSSNKTVAEIESLFQSQLGLSIQIFRRSNNLWLQTSASDNWTLEVQNRKGLNSIQS